VLGYRAWRALIEIVANPNARDRELFDAFDYFLLGIDRIDQNLTKDGVFISHRQKDWKIAEKLAGVVNRTGRDYWLDIHHAVVGKRSNHQHRQHGGRHPASGLHRDRVSQLHPRTLARDRHGVLTNSLARRPA
jgi:hypothetical protein